MNFVIKCPHCADSIIVEKVNCGIFRHGVYKATGKRLGPHSKMAHCMKVLERGLIYGCGKPFQVKKLKDQICVSVCDYI